MVRGQPTLSRGQRRSWRIALALSFGLSFAPSTWLLGWSSDLAAIATFPLVPFQHAAGSMRAWLRPMPDPRAGEPEVVRLLEEQLESFRTAKKQLEFEREELLQRIALLERARMPGGERRTRAIYANVISTQLPSARSPGSVTINAGSRNGVLPGMVATWDGDIVVARTAEDPTRLTALLVPVVALSGFEVRFFPPDRDLPANQAPGGIVRATPEGHWLVDVTQPGDVTEGWVARVADQRWPLASRGMRLGVVRSVGSRDDAPLVRRLEVHPLADLFRVPHVVLVDDLSADEDEGGER